MTLVRFIVLTLAMANARWLSMFGLRSSHHQVAIEDVDKDKTAFICPRGIYRFRTMPFGLVNAGATFLRLTDIITTGLNLEVCLLFGRHYCIFIDT